MLVTALARSAGTIDARRPVVVRALGGDEGRRRSDFLQERLGLPRCHGGRTAPSRAGTSPGSRPPAIAIPMQPAPAPPRGHPQGRARQPLEGGTDARWALRQCSSLFSWRGTRSPERDAGSDLSETSQLITFSAESRLIFSSRLAHCRHAHQTDAKNII